MVKATAAPATVNGDETNKNHWETGKVLGVGRSISQDTYFYKIASEGGMRYL